MKKRMKRAVVWLLLGALMLSCTGCVTGTIYGKPLDDMEDVDAAQGKLYGTKIRDIMAEGTLDDLNQLGYHYGQEDAETFGDFWEDWQYYQPIYGQVLSVNMQENYLYGSELVFIYEAEMENGSMQISAMFTDDFDMVMLFLYENAETVLENTRIPDGVVEKDITVGEGTEYPLNGKITYPEGAQAGDQLSAVVMVGGNGGKNDQNMKVGNTYLYRDLAWGLAQMGIVTIRYDKRTLTYGEDREDVCAGQSYFTVAWEYTEDALAAAQMLRDLDFVDDSQVYYLGHSVGGIVGSRADAEGGDFAGMILMSTSPRPWYEVAYDQYINYGLIDNSSESIYYLVSKLNTEKDYLVEGDYLEADEDDLLNDYMFNQPAAYWKDYLSFDYVQAYKDAQKPMLILQGGADFQVVPDVDFAAWQQEMEGEAYATLKCYDGLNDMFTPSQGCFAGHYKEYDMPGFASEEVIHDIGNWILNGGSLTE